MAHPVDYADGSVMELTQGSAELQGILRAAAARRQLTLVDFSAAWCGPCRMLAPVLLQLAREHKGRLAVVKVDCESTSANHALAQQHAISAFPTLHLYRDSQRVALLRGADPMALRRAVEQQLGLLGPPPTAPGALAKALARGLGQVKAGCSHDEFLALSKTLLAYVTNLLNHPEDGRYRRVKVANPTFHAKIGSKPGGLQCMEALGFQLRCEAMESVLVLDDIDPQLRATQVLLQEALAASAGAAEGAPPPRHPASEMTGAVVAGPAASGVEGGSGPAPAAMAGSHSTGPEAVGGTQPAAHAAQNGNNVTPAALARVLEKILLDCGISGKAPS